VQAAGGTPLTTQNPSPPRRVRLLLGVAAFVIVADSVSKAIAVSHIREYTYIHLIGNVLMLTLTRNGGAAFNLGGTSMTIVFTVIAASVIIYILRASRSLGSTAWAITLGLLLGGASGNLIDRIFRAPAPFRGDVIDWIQLPHWPTFNIADSSIVCAGVLVVLLSMRGVRLDGTRLTNEPSPSASSAPTESESESASASASSSSSPAPAPAPPDPPESDYPKPEYPESESPAAKSHDGT
jgi:lipoprotein signal peptidase